MPGRLALDLPVIDQARRGSQNFTAILEAVEEKNGTLVRCQAGEAAIGGRRSSARRAQSGSRSLAPPRHESPTQAP